jgi:hypothetical protein
VSVHDLRADVRRVLRLEGIIGSEGGFRRSSSASQLLPNRAGFGVYLTVCCLFYILVGLCQKKKS